MALYEEEGPDLSFIRDVIDEMKRNLEGRREQPGFRKGEPGFDALEGALSRLESAKTSFRETWCRPTWFIAR